MGSGVDVGCHVRKTELCSVQQTEKAKEDALWSLGPRNISLTGQSHTVLPGLRLLKSSSQVFLRSADRRARSIKGDFYDS